MPGFVFCLASYVTLNNFVSLLWASISPLVKGVCPGPSRVLDDRR